MAAAGGGAGTLLPWIEPFARWCSETDPRPDAELSLERLCALAREREIVLESGLPLRFVDAALPGDANYESFVFETGCVPTRSSGPGMLHDWFNALCWLRWPSIKARLNRLQADAIAERGVAGTRGALRDAITSFDESGALFVSRDGEAIAAWHRHDWQALFVNGRVRFLRDVRVLIIGHALLEKLLDPFKGVCAQALTVAVSGGLGMPDGYEGCSSGDPIASGARDPLDTLDRQVAATIDAVGFGRHRLVPLPLLGVPGWWPANEDPKFYNDADVFRQRRQRRSRE